MFIFVSIVSYSVFFYSTALCAPVLCIVHMLYFTTLCTWYCLHFCGCWFCMVLYCLPYYMEVVFIFVSIVSYSVFFYSTALCAPVLCIVHMLYFTTLCTWYCLHFCGCWFCMVLYCLPYMAL